MTCPVFKKTHRIHGCSSEKNPREIVHQDGKTIHGDRRLGKISCEVFRHQAGGERNNHYTKQHETIYIGKFWTRFADDFKNVVMIHPGNENDHEAEREPKP